MGWVGSRRGDGERVVGGGGGGGGGKRTVKEVYNGPIESRREIYVQIVCFTEDKL